MIAFKGGSGDGKLGGLIKNYIEETSASITITNTSHNQIADLTSLAVMQDMGQGGPETELELSTVQDSSFVSNSPVSTDYLNFGFKQNQIVEYEVQPGDALSFIASDYGVSINSIIWANNLKNADSISPGQTLRIPPVTGAIHKIKKGDTLESIAKKYGVEKEKIIAFNRLIDSGKLSIDEEIVVPDGKMATTVARTSASSVARFSYLPDLGSYFLIPTQGRTSQGLHGRNGIDLANSCGTPIYAAADGNIAIANGNNGWNGGYGNNIKITHSNGTETLYAHLQKVLISQGSVQKGQLIALMGGKKNSPGAGRSTGCHLHFEVHGAKNPLAK
ncbi:MAG: M23 family metallopeptidase [Candidatus Paceibacterota bacterium]